MIDPDKYKKVINKSNMNINANNKIRNFFMNLLVKILITSIVLVSLAIIYKSDGNLKNKISGYFFEESISFTKINKIYDKYLGGLLPVKKESNITSVFNEKLSYNESSIYYDGVKLTVEDNYLVPTIEEGMVVFVGEKEKYGNTVIIENLDGINFWYGNINTTSVKLYDYVEKGAYIGEVDNELYLVFSKDGNYLNYEEYIN